jgi:hypothetical protein
MTELSGLHPDFADLLVALADGGVDFVVVGAHAVAFHGAPRLTKDIDVLVRPTLDNARRCWNALAAFGAPLGAAGVAVEDLAAPGTIYQLGLPPVRIDILTEIRGVTFDDAWAGRVETCLAGRTVPLIGREALLRAKRAAGRRQDLLDVERLGGDQE